MKKQDWRMLAIPIYAPLLATLILYFFLPESPRWLYAVGRADEVKSMLLRAAETNQVRF